MISGYKLRATVCCDDDFQFLKRTLTADEYKVLENSIVENGCLNPIVVWRGLIVDGIKRYDVCERRGVEYRTKGIAFASKEDAISYICRQELTYPNIVHEKWMYLIGRLYRAEVTRWESDDAQNKINRGREFIRNSVADFTGVCGSTVQKYARYSNNIDSIRKKMPEIAIQLLNGELIASHNKVQELAGMSKKRLETVYEIVISKCLEKPVRYSDIKYYLKGKKETECFRRNDSKKFEGEVLIKKLPEYDPDAELTNLIYTVPSWTSSINRSKNNADFMNISAATKQKALGRLAQLKIAIWNMEAAIKEAL